MEFRVFGLRLTGLRDWGLGSAVSGLRVAGVQEGSR